ncbi:MAG: hypothetical protein ACM3U2_16890 [Deltaproteobacteria bacterium]
MNDDRRNPVWPWIAALLIGLPVLYVESFGPACWLADRDALSFRTVVRGYPWLYQLATYNKQPWGRGLRWYANAAKSPDTHEVTWDLYAANLKLRVEREMEHGAKKAVTIPPR